MNNTIILEYSERMEEIRKGCHALAWRRRAGRNQKVEHRPEGRSTGGA